MPRIAIAVVAFGLLLSLVIYGISFLPGSGSTEIEWDTVEAVKSPPAEKVGAGSFAIARTSLSALAPNDEGLLLFRVGGAVRVDSGGRQSTVVTCSVTSRVSGDTRIARSTKLRAAWPKPSDELQAQEVPETSTVKFDTADNNKVDLPIRDVMQRYTDSSAPTLVDWPEYVEDDQRWTWTMDQGTGPGAATLPWAVIFESETRPKGTIECRTNIGNRSSRITVPYLQDEWPIADDQPNSGDGSSTGEASNVQ